MGQGSLYAFLVVSGVLVEGIFSKLYLHITHTHLRKNHFLFGRYLFLILFPLTTTFFMMYLQGSSVFKIFLIFGLIGPLFEWLVGFSYYQIMGARLWTYKILTIDGHSSLLTIPLWGMAGVLFYLISQQVLF